MKEKIFLLDNREPLHVKNRCSKEIAIINSFNEKEIITHSIYECELSPMRVAYGRNTIRNGERAEVILEGNYSFRDGVREEGAFYNLLAVSPTTLQPIENFTVNHEDPFSSLFKEITREQEKSYRESLKLCARIQCFPTSKLAVEIMEQFESFEEGKSTERIDNWFLSRFPGKNISFHSFETALSYATTYPIFLMGNFQDKTFYFYASKDSTAGETSPLYLGKLEIRSLSNFLSLDPNVRYPSVFTLFSGEEVPLQYEQGRFFSKDSKILLQTTIALKSLLTNQFDDKTMVPVLIGKIQGKKVLGIFNRHPLGRSTYSADSGASWLPEIFGVLGAFVFFLALSIIAFWSFHWYSKKFGSFYRYYLSPKRCKPPGPKDEEMDEVKLEDQVGERAREGYEKMEEYVSHLHPSSHAAISSSQYRRMSEERNEYEAKLKRLKAEWAEKGSFIENVVESSKKLQEIVGADPEYEKIYSKIKEYKYEYSAEIGKWDDRIDYYPKESFDSLLRAEIRFNDAVRPLGEVIYDLNRKKAEGLSSDEIQELVEQPREQHLQLMEIAESLREEADIWVEESEGEIGEEVFPE